MADFKEIDKRLNIVLTAEREDGQVIHVHSVPVVKAVFESNIRLISRTMTMMVGDDLGVGGQIRVAAGYMKEAALELDGGPDAPAGGRFQGAYAALLDEIQRLSNAWVPGPRGWEMMTLADAEGQKLLSSDQVSEVTNALVYFTAASWFNSPKERKSIYQMLSRYGVQTGSWDSTAYGASLRTSTPAASTGGTETQSSIPV